MQKIWTAVDQYISDLMLPEDPILEGVLQASDAGGLPPYNVSASQGKLLWLLVKMQGARSILEIGTLGGYSTIWLARALPADGQLVTLEADPRHYEVARENVATAGFASIVETRLGLAADTLTQLIHEKHSPFDFIFIDADKPGYPEYFKLALQLTCPGSVIVADNVIRDGDVVDAHSTDPTIQGMRRFLELVAAEPRVQATTIQTVGSKGYDGFAFIIVVGDSE